MVSPFASSGPRRRLGVLLVATMHLLPLCYANGAEAWRQGVAIQVPTRSHVSSVRFSRDGSVILATTARTVYVWDSADGSEKLRFAVGDKALVDACFSPDGKRIAVYEHTGTVHIWNVGLARVEQTIKAHEDVFAEQCFVEFSIDGGRLLTAAQAQEDRALRVWDAATGKRLLEIETKDRLTESASFSADGRFIIVVGEQGSVAIHDARTGERLLSVGRTPQLEILSAAFSADGPLLALGLGDTTVCVWRVADRRELFRFQTKQEVPRALVFSPDGKLLLVAGAQANAALWDAGTGAFVSRVGIWHADNLARSDLHPPPSFSSDGKRLVSALARQIEVWTLTGVSSAQKTPKDGVEKAE